MLTIGGHLQEREVVAHLAEPAARRRAMEGFLPVIVWRYVQGRRGVGTSYAQELERAAAEAIELGAAKAQKESVRAKQERDNETLAGRKKALEAKAARYERRMQKIVAEMRSLSSRDQPQSRGAAKAPRDTASSAAYDSDKYEPTEWDEYSRNLSARYAGSILIRDGEGETPVESASKG